MILGIFVFCRDCYYGGLLIPIKFIGFAPLILFFLLSSILGNRALFYSQPFMWFGVAYLLIL